MAVATGRVGPAIEWPTLLLAILIYAGWAALTWFHDRLPIPALVLAGGWIIAWQGSLQHETIHGHPTASTRLNALIGSLPLSLWLPYRCYRRDHSAHHATGRVTDPFDDPESRYLARDRGATAGIGRQVAVSQATITGRMMVGPIVTVIGFLLAEAGRLRRQPRVVARDWMPHMIGVALVLAWLAVCRLSLGMYLLAFVYPGTALTLLRSFAEHRAAAHPGHRVAVIERAGLFGLLFLNNNLHAAHHRAPGVPWFRLPAFYRQNRTAILAANGNLRYSGYGEIIRRYWRRPHDVLIHPDWSI